MNVAQVTTMREDIPLIDRIAPWEGSTRESADYHKAKMLAERKASGLDENGEVIPTTVRPRKATVLTFLNRDADALFTSPTAMDLAVTLQMKESIQAAAIADAIALTVHRADLADLTAKQKADVRFTATHALRSQSESWRTAARTAAITACETWMQSEGGKAFRDLSPEHRHAIAVNLGPAVLCGYLGILEGSKALTPGVYLRISGEGR